MSDFFRRSFVQSLDVFANKHPEIELDILRDDLIHPFISGNKWRKLKGFIEIALKNNAKGIISKGGAYSNHLLALSFAGSMFKLKTAAFIRGDEISEQNAVMALCKLNGMSLIPVSREDYKLGIEELSENHKINADYLRVPEGGMGAASIVGFEDLREILSKNYTDIIISIGTGTSFNNFVKVLENRNIRFHGIPAFKGFVKENHINETLEKCIFHDNFSGNGFGKFDFNLINYIQDFNQKTGVLLDPIYTAKSMRGLETLVRQGAFEKGSKLLFVHTGGLTGLLSEKSLGIINNRI